MIFFRKREKEIKRRRAAAEKARKEQEARAQEPEMPGMDADFMVNHDNTFF